MDTVMLMCLLCCADNADTGLKPRLLGRCTLDGPCERFPAEGGSRDDNHQGYLLYGAGISAEHCTLRAREHHTWCGNHPDAPVHARFERETRSAVPRQDFGGGSFPAMASPPPSAAEHDCVESYQIAAGSSWSDGLCESLVVGGLGRGIPGWSHGPARCADNERQVRLHLHAHTDTSVYFCNMKYEATKMWQYKLYVGHVAVHTHALGASDDGRDLCAVAATGGIFWQRPLPHVKGVFHEHWLACPPPGQAEEAKARGETSTDDPACPSKHLSAHAATEKRACCMHDVDEHIYASPPGSVVGHDGAYDWAHQVLRWRACLALCSHTAATASCSLHHPEHHHVSSFGGQTGDVEGEEGEEGVGVGYMETLDAISDLITDGVAGAFVRFMPHDVVLVATTTRHSNASHMPGKNAEETYEFGSSGAAGGLSRVSKEVVSALSLLSHSVFDKAVVLKGLSGFEPAWNCSCQDTRYGWAHVHRGAHCCQTPGGGLFKGEGLNGGGFKVSQGREQECLLRLLQPPAPPPTRRPVLAERASHVWYAAEALELAAVHDLDRLVRFLCMVRVRAPVLLITSSDVPEHIASLLAGPDCKVLTAPRHKVVESATLDWLEAGALDLLRSKDPAHPTVVAGQLRVVVLAIGSTGGAMLQARLCHRLFTQGQDMPRHMRQVFLLDLSPIVEVLARQSPDIVSTGLGFTNGVWQRASGFQHDLLMRRLTAALNQRAGLKILVSTALVHKEDDVWKRGALYQDTFRSLARLGYALPLIAEAIHSPEQGTSMLERYGQVCYSGINDVHYMRNQGVNEARSLLVALAHFALPPRSILLKLTGRYTLIDRSLLQLLERNLGALDGVVSVAGHKSLLFTGCFAMRLELLQHALQSTDWNAVSHAGLHLESLVLHNARAICEAKDGGCRLVHVARLGVAARRSDSREPVVW